MGAATSFPGQQQQTGQIQYGNNNNNNPLAQLFGGFNPNSGLTANQQCTNYLQGLQNWANIALIVMIILVILFIICIIAHVKYSSCDYDNEAKHSAAVQILNVLFWVFIAIIFIMTVISIINWLFLKTWLDNANNQQLFINQCENIYNNWNNSNPNNTMGPISQ